MHLIRNCWRSDKIRYLVIGSWNTAFSYAMFIICHELLSPPLTLREALTFSWIIGVTQAFITQRTLVWRSKERIHAEFAKFFVVSTAQYGVDVVALTVAVDWLHLPVLASQLVISLIIIACTYYAMREWAFTQSRISKLTDDRTTEPRS
jgi:putative flippase GtrA